MSVTLSGEDLTIANQLRAVPPSTDAGDATWQLAGDLADGDDIASTRIAVGQGFGAQLDISLVRPPSADADATVKLSRRYLDDADNVLSDFTSGPILVDIVPANHTLMLSPAPAGTTQCEIAIVSAMTPPAPVLGLTRTNEYPDPRCTSAAGWTARNSWTGPTAVTGQTGLPAGVTSAVQVKAASAGSAAHSGLNMGGTPASGSPSAGGVPVTPGQTYTFSAYMLSTKAGTFQVSYRFANGSSWVAAASESPAVAAAANTWTRVSWTVTAPAGADRLQAAWRMPSSISWATTDTIRLSAVLVEIADEPAPYFDGAGTDAAIPAPKSSQWESTPDDSRSLLYTATPAAVLVQALDSSLVYSATAVELVGAALERALRRSVADIWGDPQALITAGTAALLAGQLTFLCDSLAQALGLDSVYRMPGLLTLTSTDELNGLTHRAVGTARIDPQQLSGKNPHWLYVVDFREQVA
ncbi:MAG: hypothetical protein QM582_14075 [Micropruina sp.]|uniref:hypothetical protein n=1 Tax=Micropruina sp. TaxID=2737536 RepID=UPI0039E2BE74